MMQALDAYNQKNSLFTAMSRFIGAVNNMDQTVMVPSLLRDVLLDGDAAAEDLTAPRTNAVFLRPDGDMYSSYVLLKSIRNDMEWGVLQGGVEKVEKVEVKEEDDLEKQFHFHLNGLHTVLSKLTLKANTLTKRYKEEICRRN